MSQVIREFAKKMVFRHTPLGAPKYPYLIEPIQLVTLVSEIERLRDRPGNFAEIGVARGLTTRFICEHLDTCPPEPGFRYFAIDTFASFTPEDIDHEVNVRNKNREELQQFTYNDHGVWSKNFEEFPFLRAIQSDCALVDYEAIGPFKVSLLDVDVYQATIKTLPKLYAATISGGVILVDDVAAGSIYDGAHEAYHEFCDQMGFAPEIIGSKCGVIRKP